MDNFTGRVGEIRYDNKYGAFEVIEDFGTTNKAHKIRIRFIDKNMFNFNTELEVSVSNAKHSNIVDPYKATLHNNTTCKGIYPVYVNGKNTNEYTLWDNLLKCHNNNEFDYRWLCYEYFCYDIQYIKGYELWNKYPHDYQIDKDTLQPNVELKYKTYSPSTCCFISARNNTLERHYREAYNQTGYIGVFVHNSGNYFVRVSGDYYCTLNNLIAAASLYNKVARYRGYQEQYINKLDNEMDLHEIYNYIIPPHRKHGKYQLYKLLDPSSN